MTMIVGINLGEYVIVAADRREVFIENGQVASIISDDIDKLVKWNGGVITGCGYVPLLSDLKNYLKRSEIINTDQIVALTKQVVFDLPVHASIWKQQTHWMFTYVTDSYSGSQCRLGYIKSGAPEDVHMLHTMKATIWAKLPDIEQRLEALNNALKPLSSPEEFEANFAYHSGLLKELFSYASAVDETVSENFNFYIQTREGADFLSSQA